VFLLVTLILKIIEHFRCNLPLNKQTPQIRHRRIPLARIFSPGNNIELGCSFAVAEATFDL